MPKRLVAALVFLAFAASFAGCNTMAGFGKDVQKVGAGVERTGEKIQEKAKQ